MQLRFKLVDFNIAVTSEINLPDVLVKKKKKERERELGILLLGLTLYLGEDKPLKPHED